MRSVAGSPRPGCVRGVPLRPRTVPCGCRCPSWLSRRCWRPAGARPSRGSSRPQVRGGRDWGMGRPGQAGRLMGSAGHLRGGGTDTDTGTGRAAPCPGIRRRPRVAAAGRCGCTEPPGRCERAGGGEEPPLPGAVPCVPPRRPGPGRALSGLRFSLAPQAVSGRTGGALVTSAFVSGVRTFWQAEQERRVRQTGLLRSAL